MARRAEKEQLLLLTKSIAFLEKNEPQKSNLLNRFDTLFAEHQTEPARAASPQVKLTLFYLYLP
jgi:hypothetical protein